MIPCHRLIIRHAIRRLIRHHAHHAAAVGVTIACLVPPAVVLTLPTPLAAVITASPLQMAPVPVPEPSTLAVFGVAVGGLVVGRRRR